MSSVRKLFFVSLTLTAALLFFVPINTFAQSGLDLVLNYIEAQPVSGKLAYDVSATFSLLDGSGIAIKDLKLEDVSISEDGQTIEPGSLNLVTDQPIYISLLLDTSGSMSGPKIDAAKEAASQFITGLNPDDRIAVTTFNSEIANLIDFSTDHNAAANLVTGIDVAPGSGTCLYDSAYEAIQKTAGLPLGRRAVIILTDGKDTLPSGAPCSKLNLDDVIDLAKEGNTRVPVYAIGLGDNIDEQGLTRLATLTGGRYYEAPNATKLKGLFAQLLDTLQSEYILFYTSANAPGSHTLVLNVNYLNVTTSDSRGFILPALPLNVSIISPNSGTEITSNIKIVAAITGQGQQIKNIVFMANDVSIGTDETAPYELEWAPPSDLNGDVTLSAAAISTDNTEITRGSVPVKVNVPVTTPDMTPTPSDGGGERTFFEIYKLYIIGGGAFALVLIGTALFLAITAKKRRENKERDKRWHDVVVDPPAKSSSMTEMTIDGFTMSENSSGVLMVMQSDDPAMVGQRFELVEKSTRLGRAADNDILFPKDGPVSRHHALIEERNGQLVISELVSPAADGTLKTPTFGTFLNEKQVSASTPIRNGDIIRIGKRVILKYEAPERKKDDDDAKTMDSFSVDDADKTIDG